MRGEAEWQAGHLEGSINVPYQRLREGVPEEVRQADRPLAVACSGGIRSSIAASLLARAGLTRIEHVADGGVSRREPRIVPKYSAPVASLGPCRGPEVEYPARAGLLLCGGAYSVCL